jgi:hypothetical protein
MGDGALFLDINKFAIESERLSAQNYICSGCALKWDGDSNEIRFDGSTGLQKGRCSEQIPSKPQNIATLCLGYVSVKCPSGLSVLAYESN